MTGNLINVERNTDATAYWRVIVTRPRFEKKVGQRLAQLGVEYYLPLRRELRQWHDRKKWVETPLFSNYLFVRIPDAHQNRVFDATGVLKYLRNGNKPARLLPAEIERIEKICRHGGELFVDRPIADGEGLYTVSHGEFGGLKGIWEKRNGKQYLKVELPGLCRSVWLRMTAKDASVAGSTLDRTAIPVGSI